jgi:hypothetical protein
MTSGYLAEQIIPALGEQKIEERRGWKAEQKLMVHFGTSPIHGTERAAHSLSNYDLALVSHPPYSPDLAPFHDFLFGYLQAQLVDRHGVTAVIWK